jgi:hypothetical protein
MKILASILLALSFAALAAAQPTYIAFSVNNVVRVGDNVYTAEKYVVDTHGEANAGDAASQYIMFKTEGCRHIPGATATAIYATTYAGAKIIFSDGPSCTVKTVRSTPYKIAEEPTKTGSK